MLVSALGIAIYGMFVAIVMPKVRTEKPTALCVGVAIILSCLFYYVPALKTIPAGFTIIICAVVASGIFAFAAPLNIAEEDAKNE